VCAVSAPTPPPQSTGNAAQTATWERIAHKFAGAIYDWELHDDGNVHVLLDFGGNDGDWVVIFPDGTTLGEDEL
jgi:hypothetical protein